MTVDTPAADDRGPHPRHKDEEPLSDTPESKLRAAIGRWGLPTVTALVTTAGIILRFWPRTSLWLDEALSANIASLPLADMPQALRHDGHPPLYYFLLHLWMKVAGSSDWSVRALSGVISTLGLPLAYLAGRRLAGRPSATNLDPRRVGFISVALFAALPFAIRYGAEARMYALAMILVFSGYLLIDRILNDNLQGSKLTALTLVCALNATALLWTHYWSMWLLGVVGLLTLATIWMRRNSPDRPDALRGPVALVVSLVLGGLLFIPWLPTMLYQAAHTGTPWGQRFGPVSVLVLTIVDFCGGRFGTAQFLSYLLVVSIVAGATLVIRSRSDDRSSTADVLVVGRVIQPRVRLELAVIMLTLAVGWGTAAASGNTFSSRYASVIFPLFILVAAAGIAILRSPITTVAAVSVISAICLLGSVGAVSGDRTQAGELAAAIETDLAAHQGPAAVVTCPDQLGVSLQRELDKASRYAKRAGLVIPFPTGKNPRLVDWVDYGERNDAADPGEFVDRIASRIKPGATVYLVSSPHYRTIEGKCDQVAELLTRFGTPELLVSLDADGLDESGSLRVYRPS